MNAKVNLQKSYNFFIKYLSVNSSVCFKVSIPLICKFIFDFVYFPYKLDVKELIKKRFGWAASLIRKPPFCLKNGQSLIIQRTDEAAFLGDWLPKGIAKFTIFTEPVCGYDEEASNIIWCQLFSITLRNWHPVLDKKLWGGCVECLIWQHQHHSHSPQSWLKKLFQLSHSHFFWNFWSCLCSIYEWGKVCTQKDINLWE